MTQDIQLVYPQPTRKSELLVSGLTQAFGQMGAGIAQAGAQHAANKRQDTLIAGQRQHDMDLMDRRQQGQTQQDELRAMTQDRDSFNQFMTLVGGISDPTKLANYLTIGQGLGWDQKYPAEFGALQGIKTAPDSDRFKPWSDGWSGMPETDATAFGKDLKGYQAERLASQKRGDTEFSNYTAGTLKHLTDWEDLAAFETYAIGQFPERADQIRDLVTERRSKIAPPGSDLTGLTPGHGSGIGPAEAPHAPSAAPPQPRPLGATLADTVGMAMAGSQAGPGPTIGPPTGPHPSNDPLMSGLATLYRASAPGGRQQPQQQPPQQPAAAGPARPDAMLDTIGGQMGVPPWYVALTSAPAVPPQVARLIEQGRANGHEWNDLAELLQQYSPEVWRIVAGQAGPN